MHSIAYAEWNIRWKDFLVAITHLKIPIEGSIRAWFGLTLEGISCCWHSKAKLIHEAAHSCKGKEDRESDQLLIADSFCKFECSVLLQDVQGDFPALSATKDQAESLWRTADAIICCSDEEASGFGSEGADSENVTGEGAAREPRAGLLLAMARLISLQVVIHLRHRAKLLEKSFAECT